MRHPSKDAPERPLWRCPRCGKKFVTRNLSHSCRTYPLENIFAGCNPGVFSIYKKFEAMVRACGEFTIEPRKKSVVFLVRVRTINFFPFKSFARLTFAFDVMRKHPRFTKIISYYSSFHAHEIEVHHASELDAQVQKWVEEAYARSTQGPAGRKK